MAEYRFGFADIEHSKLDEIVVMMGTYKIEKYIIALEKVTGSTHEATNGEHMHFVLYVEPKQFKNFLETLKNRYNLSGKNGKTGCYCGFVKKVKDANRLMAYTVKDQNIVWCGFKDDEIQRLVDESFPKEQSLYDQLMKHLVDNQYETLTSDKYIEPLKVELEILRYYMNKGEKICKSKLKNYTLSYLQLYAPCRFQFIDQIHFYTRN